ncbi:Protein dopey-2 [Dirofilaria immitis]
MYESMCILNHFFAAVAYCIVPFECISQCVLNRFFAAMVYIVLYCIGYISQRILNHCNNDVSFSRRYFSFIIESSERLRHNSKGLRPPSTEWYRCVDLQRFLRGAFPLENLFPHPVIAYLERDIIA